jgi:hypothetical protein
MELPLVGIKMYAKVMNYDSKQLGELCRSAEYSLINKNHSLHHSISHVEGHLELSDFKKVPFMAYGLLQLAADDQGITLPEVDITDVMQAVGELPGATEEELIEAMGVFKKKNRQLALFVYDKIRELPNGYFYHTFRATLMMYHALEIAAKRNAYISASDF